MYLRNRVIKALKVKNVLVVILGVFFLFAGTYLILDLFMHYHDDIDTIVNAKSFPGAIEWIINGIILLLIAILSRKLIGDARFYSSYFEGSLDGKISFSDFAKVTGKPVFLVKFELSVFRFIYMKKYSFITDEGKKVIELFSKKTLCECKNCGAPVEKSIYFTGTCSYCGSSDLFAKILSGDRFYSISNEVKKGYKKPEFYEKENLDMKKKLFLILIIVAIGISVIFGFMIADSISKYNDKDYLNKQLLADNGFYSYAQIRDNLNILILFASLFALILLVLAVRRALKIIYLDEAETCAIEFSRAEKPFLPAEDIPSIKAKGPKKMRKVRGALRHGYLANCTLEVHDEEMKVALAKKIVKDTCPSCATPITGAVDEDYICQTCGNKIMGVIEKK